MKVVVVALGKIGLPLAVHAARAGHQVVGCDVNATVCELVNRAEEPFPGETGLKAALEEVVGDGRLRAQTDTTAAVAEGPDLVIAVPPLIVDAAARPDWTILDSVVGDIAGGLRAGTTVSIETTVPAGTTRERIAPALAAGSGLEPELDFFTVFSPERVYSGRIFRDLDTYPKLVGGLSAAGEARGVELYRAFIGGNAEVWPMGSAEAAELTKLAETTYRDVNIALANEFAQHADVLGVDIGRVIDAANSQPFSHIHRPGVAVGGHCIPVYPHFYLQGDAAAQLPSAARRVNGEMPSYAVGLMQTELGGLRDRRVLILGVAYRGGVRETAFSGAFGLRDALRAAGATPLAADPLYSDEELRALGFEPWDGNPIDGAILQADHAEYSALTPAQLPGLRALVDGRDALDPDPFRAAGVAVRRIGRP
ncbi:nucleotide sugar dehydrogenase [Conexibacter stalactiti]|uniref:Nucleotide sugar dehydrogenase n=1 Tax=Conexibacter stalactiti TaxID=1940611 RepID=A0ABU4HIY8_9ACTN|nr:nucleotide sugar dehydrogenase [Conexibacter stalactiti]MDW5593286.1 nucleotide sugar dehydrogenase [Conexibacter stalactiti]MEC5033927.1 nucleotide sugar dehydrogenase [Conexibacter stalactiti]